MAEYGAGLSIANWFVAALKVVGAGIAVLSVAARPPLSPRLMNLSIWAAAGTLGIYALGSIVQLVGMASGLAGSPDQITPAGIVYVLGFLLAAVGFVALAVSHSSRAGLGVRVALGGAFGGVIILGLILFGLPILLSALGVFPADG